MSVRITAISATAVALAASAALVLPGQAGAATGEVVQQRQNLDCGFTRSYVARDKGWPNAPHYKHCSHDGKPVLLLTHTNGPDGNFCSPAHQAHEAAQVPPVKSGKFEYEVVWVEVVGQCGGVG